MIFCKKKRIHRNSVFVYPNDEWILDVDCYFIILKKLNIKILELLKCNTNDYKNIEDKFFELATELNRIIPIKKSKLNPGDGVLELSGYFDFLLNDYNKMFSDYKDFIISCNFIRNKYQHAPHTMKMKEYTGSAKIKKIEFVYLKRNNVLGISLGNDIYSIDTDDIIKVVLQLNKVFYKIQKQFYISANKRNYDLKNIYFSSIINFNEDNFNSQLSK